MNFSFTVDDTNPELIAEEFYHMQIDRLSDKEAFINLFKAFMGIG
jgi:hypothetical protein